MADTDKRGVFRRLKVVEDRSVDDIELVDDGHAKEDGCLSPIRVKPETRTHASELDKTILKARLARTIVILPVLQTFFVCANGWF